MTRLVRGDVFEQRELFDSLHEFVVEGVRKANVIIFDEIKQRLDIF